MKNFFVLLKNAILICVVILSFQTLHSLAEPLPNDASKSETPRKDQAARLEKLKLLKDSGDLSEDEFQAKVKLVEHQSSNDGDNHSPNNLAHNEGKAVRLEKLKTLKDSGAITEDEYQAKLKQVNETSTIEANISESRTDAPSNTKNVSVCTTVLIETSEGNIEIELFADKAPISVSNFLGYVDSGFYNNTMFHRVLRKFMIQGGGFDPNMKQKITKSAIKNEARNGLKNERGTVAMARTTVVDGATSQFYINVANNDFLNNSPSDFGYAVFARVVSGMDVVDKIASVKTTKRNGMGDVPSNAVMIKSVTRRGNFDESTTIAPLIGKYKMTGEVSNPGLHQLTQGLKLLTALKYSAYADQNKVFLIRNNERVEVNLKDIRKGKRQDVNIMPGDVIEVPRSKW